MSNFFKSLSRNDIFTGISGLASIISLVLAIFLTDNIVLFIILTLQIGIVLILFYLLRYNSKIVGRLDTVTLDIINTSIELECDEDSGDYKSSEDIIIAVRSLLSQDILNEQHKAHLQIRFPFQIKMDLSISDKIKKDTFTNDCWNILIPLDSNISYIILRSINLHSDELTNFMKSSKQIELTLESDLLSVDKRESISVFIS